MGVQAHQEWSDSWLPKLRADMRAAKAEVALIVSQALPKGMDFSISSTAYGWLNRNVRFPLRSVFDRG